MRDLLAPTRAFITSRCGKWYAWHDFTGGTIPTLYVTGECSLDVRGVKVVLQRVNVQGANRRVLRLDKVVIAAPGADADTPVAIRFEERTSARYTQVHIQPDDLFIDVMVTA
jgi:hypothetical protein